MKSVLLKPLITLTLGVLMISAGIQQAHAQNVNNPKQKYSHFKQKTSGELDDVGHSLAWVGVIAEGVVGGLIAYGTIQEFFHKDLNTISRINAMKNIQTTGVLAIDLSSKEFKYLWAQYLQSEKQAVAVATAKVTSAKAVMDAASGALSNASILPTEVSLGSAPHTNPKDVVKSAVDMLNSAEEKYNAASKELAEAEATLAKRRLDFFNPAEANKDIFASAEARAVRAEVSRYMRTSKVKVAGNSLGAIFGVYVIIDSLYKVMILIDNRSPGIAPLLINTAE